MSRHLHNLARTAMVGGFMMLLGAPQRSVLALVGAAVMTLGLAGAMWFRLRGELREVQAVEVKRCG